MPALSSHTHASQPPLTARPWPARPWPVLRAPTGLPDVRVMLPDGEHGALPGSIWPSMAARQGSAALGGTPAPVSVIEVPRQDANRLLETWEHPLGAYRRPFGEQHFVLLAGDEPAAVASSSSVRSATVAGGLRRKQVVELARIARSPAHPRAMRAMLRLWTDYLAPSWQDKYGSRGWTVDAVISYALPGTPSKGALYRFDGWEKLGTTNPWGGSTGWGQPSKTDALGDGRKTVYVYRYP